MKQHVYMHLNVNININTRRRRRPVSLQTIRKATSHSLGLHVCKKCLLWGPMYGSRAYYGLFGAPGIRPRRQVMRAVRSEFSSPKAPSNCEPKVGIWRAPPRPRHIPSVGPKGECRILMFHIMLYRTILHNNIPYCIVYYIKIWSDAYVYVFLWA